jgi:hypothetical protein
LSISPIYYENTFWAFQMGISLSACFGFIGLALIYFKQSKRRYITQLTIFSTLLISTFSSSLGIVFVTMSICASLFHKKSLLLPSFLPLITWVFWIQHYNLSSILTKDKIFFTVNNFTQFMAVGLNETLTSFFPIQSLGVIICAFYVLAAFRLNILNPKIQLILVIHLLGIVVVWFLLTYGRAGEGGSVNLVLATASRYTFATSILLWIPILYGVDATLREYRLKYFVLPFTILYFLWGSTTLNGRANQRESEAFEIKSSLFHSVSSFKSENKTINLPGSVQQLSLNDVEYFSKSGKLSQLSDK